MKYLLVILRFIRGYVVFKAEKGFIERFFNLCAKNKAHIWNVTVENNVLTACISVHNFKKLRPVARKSGVKITIIKKSGFIFKYRQYNKRVGLAAGLAIFLLFHLVMNQFVWCIDVSGNEIISKDEIILKAEEKGLTFGTYKKNFNEVKAAREIAAAYEGKVPWLSINIKGSMATVELRENNKTISELEDNSPCNLIADFDGVILSIETMRGDTAVEIGNGVKKGDMLVSGVIVNEDLSSTYYKAKGKITALHSSSSEINKSAVNESHRITSVKNFYGVGLFGIEIPFGSFNEDKNQLILADKRHLEINGYKLPFYISEFTVIKSNEVKDASENTYIILSEDINSEIYTEHKNSTIVTKEEKLTFKNNSYIFSGEYTLIDFIGEEKPILSESSK